MDEEQEILRKPNFPMSVVSIGESAWRFCSNRDFMIYKKKSRWWLESQFGWSGDVLIKGSLKECLRHIAQCYREEAEQYEL